jgi:hypothetical protein
MPAWLKRLGRWYMRLIEGNLYESEPKQPLLPPPRIDTEASLSEIMSQISEQESPLKTALNQMLEKVRALHVEPGQVNYNSQGAEFYFRIEWHSGTKTTSFKIWLGKGADINDSHEPASWNTPNPYLYALCLKLFPDISQPTFRLLWKNDEIMCNAAYYRVCDVPVAIYIY